MNKNPQRNMIKLDLEPGEGGVPHRLYDLSIEDLIERKKQSFVLPSARDAMNYLGVASTTFYNNRYPGKRLYSVAHDRYFAVRIEKCSA